MSVWSIDRLPVAEARLIDGYLQRVGRALYIASMYEHRCKFLLSCVLFLDRGGKILVEDAADKLAKYIRRAKLDQAIRSIRKSAELNESAFATLDRARAARNWIAHQSTELGSLSSVSQATIEQFHEQLTTHAIALLHGDKFVSEWMEQMESGSDWSPSMNSAGYVAEALHWIQTGRVRLA